MVNSHFIPQFILRNFCSDNKIQYYNKSTQTLETRSTRSVFSEKGYYPDHLEKELCSKIEYQFSVVLNNKILNARNNITLNYEDMWILKKFLIITMLRIHDDNMEHNTWYKFLKRDGFIQNPDEFQSKFSGDFYENITKILNCSDPISALELTETEANKKMLHEQKIISDFEYQTAVNNLLTAKANLAQAEAAYAAAKQNLGFCTVTSPSDGVIGTFPYRVGALVSASVAQPLTTVSQIGDMYVYFSMTEKQLLALTKAGGTLKEQLEKMPAVKLQLSDGTMYDAEGKIDAVSGVIDQTTGSVSMRAIFPNKQNILRSGGMANVVFPYAMDNIILIPQTATQEIQDKKFVYVLQADSTLKHTEIQVPNLNDGKNYIVTGGLKEGDKVVVEGVQTLQDGQKIVPITVAQKEAKYQKALQDQRDGNIQTAFN